MKKQKMFKENDLIYCSKIKGIHRVVKVLKEEGRDDQLITEYLYDDKYNRILSSYKDREYTISSAYCKPVELDKLLLFEKKKFEKIETTIKNLKMIKKWEKDFSI